MARKKSYVPKKFEAMSFGDPELRYSDRFGNRRKDSFCMVFDSLLQSPAYIDLKPVQKNLYLLCASRLYGHRKPGSDHEEEELQGSDKFYLNWKEVHGAFGMYSDNNHSRFYKDMQALEEHGFIKKISSGKYHHAKSVYQYDFRWQVWEPGTNFRESKMNHYSNVPEPLEEEQ